MFGIVFLRSKDVYLPLVSLPFFTEITEIDLQKHLRFHKLKNSARRLLYEKYFFLNSTIIHIVFFSKFISISHNFLYKIIIFILCRRRQPQLLLERAMRQRGPEREVCSIRGSFSGNVSQEFMYPEEISLCVRSFISGYSSVGSGEPVRGSFGSGMGFEKFSQYQFTYKLKAPM